MTRIENHRISTAVVAIAVLASVLVVIISVISGHIALAQTNSGIDISESTSQTQNCQSAGGTSPITASCGASSSHTVTNSGGVVH